MKPKYSINLQKIKKVAGNVVFYGMMAWTVHATVVFFASGSMGYIASKEVQRQSDIREKIYELRQDLAEYTFLSEKSKEGFKLEEKKLQNEYNSLEKKMAEGKASWKKGQRRVLMPWTYLTD